MNNNEYQTLGMTQHMLREFRAQCNQRQESEQQRQQFQADYPRLGNELLDYPIFTNHTCPQHAATELLAPEMNEAHCQRWRFFFTPDPHQLPHESHALALNQQLAMLKHQYRTATSPRLAALFAAVLTIILLVMRGHFLLPLAPIGALAWYWLRSERQSRQARQDLIQHLEQMKTLHQQQETLQHQLASLPPTATLEHMQQCYQQAIAQLFRRTLQRVLRPHELDDLHKVLSKRHWQGFITESWGHLQLPLHGKADKQIHTLLLDSANNGLMAMQNAAHGRKGDNIFRVQYLHLWVLTERGLLLGCGYYDRVTDQFLQEQYEFYPYAQLTQVRLSEQTLPELPALKAALPDNVHRHYFHAPVTVLSVTTASGKTHECSILPTSPRHEWRDSYGLDTDIHRLNRHLHERIVGVSAQAA